VKIEEIYQTYRDDKQKITKCLQAFSE